MTDIILAVLVTITGSFLALWLTIWLTVVTLWMLPFAGLCLIEVVAMTGDILKSLLAPARWLLRLIEGTHHANHQHLRLANLPLNDGGIYNLHRLPTGPNNSRPGTTVAREVLKI